MWPFKKKETSKTNQESIVNTPILRDNTVNIQMFGASTANYIHLIGDNKKPLRNGISILSYTDKFYHIVGIKNN